jgi:hypothetical protein
LKSAIVARVVLLAHITTMFAVGAQAPALGMSEAFRNPPAEARPHTRWWWMGNAITKEDITWQLEQMHEKGIGGVEQITMMEVYEKGNAPYLSDDYFELVTHAIKEAKRLGMEFSLNFGGPGWIIGGEWIAKEDSSKNMLPTHMVLEGGAKFSGEVPTDLGDYPRTGQTRPGPISKDDSILAVIAGRIEEGVIVESSLTDLTPRLNGRNLEWDVPEGQWRLMVFWLKYTEHYNNVDHFNKGAMTRYCETLGGQFRDAFGEEFGTTVDSMFCDSFEVPMLHNGIYWSTSLMEQFNEFKGYELTPYLPAIWWEVGEISPKIRYDVNEFLHHIGLEAFFEPYLAWCEANGVKGRIQPYGFPTDILEGAGLTHIPEMEITAGEKDAVPWFDTRIGPKKYVASGAHLYGRDIVTVEAYTYLHWQPGHATLKELKISSDVFLKYGANKFYNVGYTCTPEMDFVPARRFWSEMVISHPNVWWEQYPLLSNYIARSCAVLQNGRFVGDIAVYSPLANQWTKDARNARNWTRQFDWGGLGKRLLANGYDFDIVNDDILLNKAEFDNHLILVRDLEYHALLLPNIESLPLESMKRIQEYAKGGGLVIAMERIPESSTGFENWQANDAEVKAISDEMFDTPVWRRNPTAPRDYGRGKTYHIRHIIDTSDQLEWHASATDPFLNILRDRITPDFGIDFQKQNMRENHGLIYLHKKTEDKDMYFVTNIQENAVNMPVAFRMSGRIPTEWNPYDGSITSLYEYREDGDVTWLPIRLAPYESTFVIFEDKPFKPHVVDSEFAQILRADATSATVLADRNGLQTLRLNDSPPTRFNVTGVLSDYVIAGDWKLTLEGINFPRLEKTLPILSSWTDSADTKHFSGTGEYEIEFELTEEYTANDLRLNLSLGDVGTIAEVILNGKPVGFIWMVGQTLDITDATKPGINTLCINVTNTLINRVVGLKEVPPVPEELQPRLGKGLGPGATAMKGLMEYEPLPNSGLLGPVIIKPQKEIRVAVEKKN